MKVVGCIVAGLALLGMQGCGGERAVEPADVPVDPADEVLVAETPVGEPTPLDEIEQVELAEAPEEQEVSLPEVLPLHEVRVVTLVEQDDDNVWASLMRPGFHDSGQTVRVGDVYDGEFEVVAIDAEAEEVLLSRDDQLYLVTMTPGETGSHVDLYTLPKEAPASGPIEVEFPEE